MGFGEFISWLLSTHPASKLMTSEDLRKIRKSRDNGNRGRREGWGGGTRMSESYLRQ